MPKTAKPAPGQPPRSGSVVELWRSITARNPYDAGTHRQYVYAYLCRYGLAWSTAVERYRELTTQESRLMYAPTMQHYSDRLAGLKEQIQNLAFVTDDDPLSVAKTRRRHRLADAASGMSKKGGK